MVGRDAEEQGAARCTERDRRAPPTNDRGATNEVFLTASEIGLLEKKGLNR
jgi:hypothetical protein